MPDAAAATSGAAGVGQCEDLSACLRGILFSASQWHQEGVRKVITPFRALEYRGYVPDVDFSEEDRVFRGVIHGLLRSPVCFEGRTVEKLEREFRCAVDVCLKISGAFVEVRKPSGHLKLLP